MRAVLVLVALGASLAGCGNREQPPLIKGELVRLSRAGRAPFDDTRILVRPDHHARVTSRAGSAVLDLGPDSYELLRRDLDAARVAELELKPSRATVPGPDAYRYELAYRGRTLRFEENEVPTPLRNVILRLSHFLDADPRDPTAG